MRPPLSRPVRPTDGLWLLLLVAVVLCGCHRRSSPDDLIVATWSNGSLTAAELDDWLAFRGQPEGPEALENETRQLVLNRFLESEALTHKLDTTPAVTFRLRMAEESELARAWRQKLVSTVVVSPEEINEILSTHPNAFHTPKKYRLLNLYKSFPSDADQSTALRRRMEVLRSRLQAGADPDAIIRAESESTTRYRGGRMGAMSLDDLPDGLHGVVDGMTGGVVSEVLESPDGLTILVCDGTIDPRTPTVDEQRAMIKKNLVRLRTREAAEQAAAQLLEQAALEIRTDVALAPSAPPHEVVATYRNETLDRTELDLLFASRNRLASGSPRTADRVESVVKDHVLTQLAAERARDLGLQDAAVSNRMGQRRMTILAAEALRRRVEERFSEPTSNDVRAYIEQNRSAFRHPPEIDFMAIRIAFDKGTITDAHARAREALDAVENRTMSFDEAVHRFSDTASNGGSQIETLTARRFASLGPSVGRAVDGLEPGQISGLIRQDDRFWIVKLVDRRPGRLMSLDEARTTARKRLGQEGVDAQATLIEDQILAELDLTLEKTTPGRTRRPGAEES